MAVLIGMSGDVKGKNFPIDREEITMGRKSSNTIVLDNPTVSGTHCCVAHEGDRFLLRDLNSTNGTRLNSKEVTEVELKPKDLIQVGSVEFMFDADDSEVVATSSFAQAHVEVTEGPARAPESFNSISPFGARSKENKGWWFLIIAVIGILALAGFVLLFIKLITTG